MNINWKDVYLNCKKELIKVSKDPDMTGDTGMVYMPRWSVLFGKFYKIKHYMKRIEFRAIIFGLDKEECIK